MRRIAAAVLTIAGLTVVAVAPVSADAAALEASPSVGVGDPVVVVGHGLKPSEGYELILGAPPLRGSPSTCGVRIGGPRDATGSRTVFSGRVPTRLPCHLPDGTRVGTRRVTPGQGYNLAVCVPTKPSLCDGDTYSARGVRVLRAGRACREVAFSRGTEDLASGIRAAGVGCRTARALASRSKHESARCLAHGSCSYRAEGFRCRGTADLSEMPRTVFRCTRRGTRVAFVKT